MRVLPTYLVAVGLEHDLSRHLPHRQTFNILLYLHIF